MACVVMANLNLQLKSLDLRGKLYNVPPQLLSRYVLEGNFVIYTSGYMQSLLGNVVLSFIA